MIINKFLVWCCVKNMNVMNYELDTGEIIVGYKMLRKRLGPQRRRRK